MSAWVHTFVAFLVCTLTGVAQQPDHVLRPDTYARGPATEAEAHAHRIIERAIRAHGGREAWQGKKDASFTTTWTHYQQGRPRFSSRYVVKFPTTPGPRRVIVEAEENGKPVIMGMSGVRSWFVVGGEPRDDAASLRANRAFVKKAYGLLAVPFMLDDPSCRFLYDGHEVRGGIDMDRVRAECGLEPSTLLLFESHDGRLAGLGSAVTSPPTSTLGEAHDYEVVQGIAIPRMQTFDRVDPSTGEVSRALSVSVHDVRFDNGFPAEMFEPPAVP
ncbi:MAG: hypothetical protein ACREAA_08550 [Candidatus Polarisedimenticolia bacterium]